jgi:hypothetical protein
MTDHVRYMQNSNVVQFLAMLKKDDTTKQLVYYQVIPLGSRGGSFVLILWSGRNRDIHEQRLQHPDPRVLG